MGSVGSAVPESNNAAPEHHGRSRQLRRHPCLPACLPARLIAPWRPHPALPAAGGQLVKDELGISLDKADDSILGTAAKVRTRPPACLPALLACFL